MEASAAPAPRRPLRAPLRSVSPKLLRLASDERLVAHVRAGSHAAYEAIYDRHHRGILSFCRHMLGDREEAEDAVQHTFMAAYRELGRSDREMQLRAWLYAIARNRCVSQMRARRERSTAEWVEPATEGLASEVQRRADLQDMLRDLAALPEDQRAALVLSEMGDLGHDEIGAVLGCPRDKVKALVFQARTSLQLSRQARDADCGDIRVQISTLTGGALRRSELRRHVAVCDGCREFEAEVKRQRRAMAAVLPVLPTLALKESALAAALGGGGAAAAGVAGGLTAAGGTSALVAKVLTVAAVASGGSAAGYQAVTDGGEGVRQAKPAAEPTGEGAGSATRPSREERSGSRAPLGEERGRDLARTRGKGRKLGLLKPRPGRRARPDGRGQGAERRAAARDKGGHRGRGGAPAAPADRAAASKPVAPKPAQKARPAPVMPKTVPAPPRMRGTSGTKGKP